MARHRWIADEYDSATKHAILVGDHAGHLARVLRAKIGQQFDIAIEEDGRPAVRRGTIVSVEPDRVEFQLTSVVAENRKVAAMRLFLAIFKFDRMEWAIEKAVEMGASRIVPVIARRTEKHLALAADKRLQRWRRLAQEAAEQSRQSRVPEVTPPVKLRAALPEATGLCVVLSERGGIPLAQVIAERHKDVARGIVLAIGPEGGWTDDELIVFRDASFVAASLGTGILRAETAAIAALAIVASQLQRTT